ncbi:MAG: uracil-DNA glycosylase [Candidatus Thorarchaeota archaeon]|nr:uracil-DNA glycosylase [Candidatus Thorarchaeota archaeon]
MVISQLDAIRSEIAQCTNCPLHETRLHTVPGEGSPTARLMIVGEAPGAREDETGRPFVGRSGELLTTLLSEIGISRDEIFITSVMKCRPPKNRTPRQGEIASCIPYLFRQIEAIRPAIVMLVGGVAISAVIGPWRLSEAHGRFYETEEQKFFMTYHPAAALRFPKTADIIRQDLQIIKAELELSGH